MQNRENLLYCIQISHDFLMSYLAEGKNTFDECTTGEVQSLHRTEVGAL